MVRFLLTANATRAMREEAIVSVNRLRILVCAALTGFGAMFGVTAQATQYGVVFDPPFTVPGLMVIDVPNGSPCHDGGFQACPFVVLSVDFTDSSGNEWGIPGPESPPGTAVDFSEPDDTLLHVEVTITDLILIHGEVGCGENGPSLVIGIEDDVTFTCGRILTTGSVTSITKVPEPGTLALLGAGFAAIGVARRKRR